MSQFTLFSALLLVFSFYYKSVWATSTYAGLYYQIDLIHTNDLSTTTIYIYVESNRVLEIYNSPLDFNSNNNNIIAVNTYQSNDNVFVYPLIEYNGISTHGISFTVNGISTNLYLDLLPPLSLALRHETGLHVHVTATITIIPIQFYTSTVQTPTPTTPMTMYLTVLFQRVIGVYIDILLDRAVYQYKSDNLLLPPGSIGGNNNKFDYTNGPPSFDVTVGGIVYVYNGIKYKLYYTAGGFFYSTYGASAAPVTVPVTITLTPIPTEYYKLIVSSLSTRVLYLTVVDTLVTGAYPSLAEVRALTNNILLPVDAYNNNDNGIRVKNGGPFYGINSDGMGLYLENTNTALHSLPVVTPYMFLSFDFIGSTYHIPATISAVPFSITDSPTSVPTAAPTAKPTATPTKVPTKQPPRAPTRAPTKAPTSTPTRAPNRTPTKVPTIPPTAAPS